MIDDDLYDRCLPVLEDKTLEEERQTYTRDGEKRPGFTSSVVPTLEEKLLIERQEQEQSRLNVGSDEHLDGDATPVPNGTAKYQNGDAHHAMADEMYASPWVYAGYAFLQDLCAVDWAAGSRYSGD